MPDNFTTFDLDAWTYKMANIASTNVTRLDIISSTPGSVHNTIQITAATSPQEERAVIIFDRLYSLLQANSSLFGDNGINITSYKAGSSTKAEPVQNTNDKKSKFPLIPVIVGVIAGVLLIILIVIFIIVLRKRSINKNRKSKREIAMKNMCKCKFFTCIIVF